MRSRRSDRDKLNSAAHIKRNTEGTSNEVSFSVLDAAKMRMEGKGASSQGHALGRVRLFTLSGKRAGDAGSRFAAKAEGRAEQARSGGMSAQEVVAARKSRRRLRRLVTGAVIAVAAVAAVVAVGTFAYNAYEGNQNRVGTLRDAITRLSEVDETLIALGDVVDGGVDPNSAETVTALVDELPRTADTLDEIREGAASVSEDMVMPQDQEAATSVLNSIDARADMVQNGQLIVEELSSALAARSAVLEAWNSILSADGYARQAAASANENTAEGMTTSRDQTLSALDALNTAAELLSQAAEAYPSADLSAYQDYVAKRIEALNHALLSSEAFLAEDTATATSQNDAYNLADREAAALAEDLPDDIEDVIVEAYEGNVADAVQAFGEAQSRAASTDGYLRTYLGL